MFRPQVPDIRLLFQPLIFPQSTYRTAIYTTLPRLLTIHFHKPLSVRSSFYSVTQKSQIQHAIETQGGLTVSDRGYGFISPQTSVVSHSLFLLDEKPYW